MAKTKSKPRAEAFRFTLETVGPTPNAKELRRRIEEARTEALKELNKPDVRVSVKPPGGLFGGGLEIVYLLHISWPYLHAAGKVIATGAGTEAGKQLFQYFAKALRKRDILPSAPESVAAAEASKPKPETNKARDKKKGAKPSHKKR
jgi:hypothetical protein